MGMTAAQDIPLVPVSAGQTKHFIPRQKHRSKDSEIVFNTADFKEYVTGFRKRKQQRRKDYLHKQKVREKQEKMENRLEKRREMKEQLGLPEDYGVADSDAEREQQEQQIDVQVAQYDANDGMAAVVTTTQIRYDSDAGDESDSELGNGSGQIDQGRNDGQLYIKGTGYARSNLQNKEGSEGVGVGNQQQQTTVHPSTKSKSRIKLAAALHKKRKHGQQQTKKKKSKGNTKGKAGKGRQK